jgi:alpha-L-arabinofuranosidase
VNGGGRVRTNRLHYLFLLCLTCFFTTARAQEELAATLEIDATKVENTISPALYGQFAEFMYQDIKGGLCAELVRNRGFDEPPNAAGLPRDWERYPDDRNHDGRMQLTWDSAVYYPIASDQNTLPAQHSLRVDIHGADGQPGGIRQGWIPIREKLSYHGYVWLKSASYQGRITVVLEADETGGEQYAAANLEGIHGDWAKYSFTLTPTKSDPLAKIALLFRGSGRLWLDQVSLVPGDANGGIRHEVETRVADLHPAFIRWPGGNVAQDYHWKWGVGPRDHRPVWTNLAWGNELEPSDLGTDEFIQFARRVGAEPALTVNVEGRGGTADEAAAWVEYCNGHPQTKYGAMRAANGHPESFHVRYWEIGNEIWGNWVRGHTDAATYANNLNRYVEKMKQVDPAISIIASGNNDLDWNRTVLRIAGRNIDYLSIHHYYGNSEMKGDADNLRAHPLHYERFYGEMLRMLKELVPAHEIKLAINEWNTSLSLPAQHAMQSALYAARLMNVFERWGDVVEMTAVSDLVNGWTGGVIQASRHAVFVTPTYLVNQLYASHLGSQRLAVSLHGPTFDTTLEGTGIPTLDGVASRSEDGTQIFVKMVNTDPTRAVRTKISLIGGHISSRGQFEILNGPTLTTSNDFAHPNAVSIKKEMIATGSSFDVVFPQHSVSVLTVEVQR